MLTLPSSLFLFFFFNDTATTEIYTLSLHDALPIFEDDGRGVSADALAHVFDPAFSTTSSGSGLGLAIAKRLVESWGGTIAQDRKSTRLNSSHSQISYAVFCLKKKKNKRNTPTSDMS